MKMYTVRQTHIIGTGRDQTMVHPVMAEIALLRDTAGLVIGDGVIGTFLYAGLTPGAEFVVHDDNAVISFVNSLFRAGIGTRRIIAVPAQVDLEYKFRLIIDPTRSVFPNRDQLDPVCRPVFLLAGNFTGSATPAEMMVYTQLKFIHNLFP